jgi:hypothetical protein
MGHVVHTRGIGYKGLNHLKRDDAAGCLGDE